MDIRVVSSLVASWRRDRGPVAVRGVESVPVFEVFTLITHTVTRTRATPKLLRVQPTTESTQSTHTRCALFTTRPHHSSLITVVVVVVIAKLKEWEG